MLNHSGIFIDNRTVSARLIICDYFNWAYEKKFHTEQTKHTSRDKSIALLSNKDITEFSRLDNQFVKLQNTKFIATNTDKYQPTSISNNQALIAY